MISWLNCPPSVNTWRLIKDRGPAAIKWGLRRGGAGVKRNIIFERGPWGNQRKIYSYRGDRGDQERGLILEEAKG